jgi:DNA mismatch repair protein MutS2
MQDIIDKLDLTDYIGTLQSLFAREKPIAIEGDINIHHKLISQLSNYDLKELPKVSNLDSALMHLQKQGDLKLYEVFEFVKIFEYFLYLKRFDFEGKLGEWNDKIIIPNEIKTLVDIFDNKGNIKSGFDDDLDRVNTNLHSNKEAIKQNLYSVINNKKLQPYLVDHQVHLVYGEQTLMVRGGFNHVLKAKVLDRSSAGFFFVLPHSVSDLKQKQEELLNLKEEILYKLAKEYSSLLNKNLMVLKFINKEFDRVDHYISRVFFAKLDDRSFILPSSKNKVNRLIDFKHPALEEPKPVSIDFSKSVVMITGVNAGGKTMLLKSILSAVFMSKYLIPYKCDDEQTKIGSFKTIQTILDDPQNVKNDISTFAGRMVEFSKVFSKSNSIVGVDEIELGTDSDEAASLFKVIIEKLIKNDIKIVITTHHKRLAALLAKNEDVELIAALYDEENRKPTYEFLQGTIGKSYAFETASRYGIPLDIVNEAKKVYGEDKDKLNELIERSSLLEKEYQEKIQKLDEDIAKYDKLNSQLKEQKENADKIIYDEKLALEKEYKDAIEDAKKAIKTTQSSEAHKLLNQAHKKKQSIKVQKHQEPIDLKVGDMVKYRNTKGVLISLKGKKATIESDDGMKLQVLKDELKRSGNLPKIKQNKNHNIKVNIQKPDSGHITLDLHGQRAEEATANLDKFISDALIAGFDEVLVYHGIGTGKLAYAVKVFLEGHPSVKSFEDALTGSGGYGAKVVKL